MARSREMTGPYELDPRGSLLTTRDTPDWPLQKAGHGELVETPEGEWYLTHLAAVSRAVRVGAGVPENAAEPLEETRSATPVMPCPRSAAGPG